MTTVIKRPDDISFDQVVEYISQAKVSGDFRRDILENRLERIGAKDVLENGIIATRGFPFKYHSPLDEAILILHYFLTKSNAIPGAFVRINSIHLPNKEEENTLSFWKSPKAGLYLDLQNLVENNNIARRPKDEQSSDFPRSPQKRIFVFRDNAHLAFLEATGIGVILEQQSMDIETSFVLMNKQTHERRSVIRGGTVLIQLLHEEDEKCEWALIIDQIDVTSEPYGNQILCRWHKGRFCNEGVREQYIEQMDFDIEEYVKLFDLEPCDPEYRTGSDTYEFATEPSEFETLLKANFKKAFGENGEAQTHYDDQFAIRSVPVTLKQFHEALSRTDQSENITAIDASSVKSTLRIHEADPNYRHWIRLTVERAILNPNVSLNRIYILDHQKPSDHSFFEQEIALYRDYLTNSIQKLSDVWPEQDIIASPSKTVLENHSNIRIYVTTKKRVKRFCEDLVDTNKRKLFELLLSDFFPAEEPEPNQNKIKRRIGFYMPRLDFLYSEKLIFNYKDYRGEPGQALYDANLFAPGDPEQSLGDVISYLPQNDFDGKRDKYSRLFEVIRGLSVQILPNTTQGVPTLTELDQQLRSVNLTDDQLQRILEPSTPQQSTNSRKAKVFVSHVVEDEGKALQVVARLRSEGYDAWQYQDGTFIGENHVLAQSYEIEACDFFFCCYSTVSKNKKPSEFQAELNQAIERRKRFDRRDIFLLVARFDEVEIPLDLEKTCRFATLFKEGQWQESEWKRLINSIEEGLRRRGA